MIRKLAATIALAAGMGAALFGAGTAGADVAPQSGCSAAATDSIYQATWENVPVVDEDGLPVLDVAGEPVYEYTPTWGWLCVYPSDSNASNGTPTRSNMDGKGNGSYTKAGAGKGNGQYVTQN